MKPVAVAFTVCALLASGLVAGSDVRFADNGRSARPAVKPAGKPVPPSPAASAVDEDVYVIRQRAGARQTAQANRADTVAQEAGTATWPVATAPAFPTPAGPELITPQPEAGSPAGPPLFDRVEYHDLHHVHPSAVETIVTVLDPVGQPWQPWRAVEPRYVSVRILVPPDAQPRVKQSRGGRNVKYEYGGYAVEIESKSGTVYVDYDD